MFLQRTCVKWSIKVPCPVVRFYTSVSVVQACVWALSLFDVGIIYEYYGRLSKRDDSSQSITDFEK